MILGRLIHFRGDDGKEINLNHFEGAKICFPSTGGAKEKCHTAISASFSTSSSSSSFGLLLPPSASFCLLLLVGLLVCLFVPLVVILLLLLLLLLLLAPPCSLFSLFLSLSSHTGCSLLCFSWDHSGGCWLPGDPWRTIRIPCCPGFLSGILFHVRQSSQLLFLHPQGLLPDALRFFKLIWDSPRFSKILQDSLTFPGLSRIL